MFCASAILDVGSKRMAHLSMLIINNFFNCSVVSGENLHICYEIYNDQKEIRETFFDVNTF